MPQKVSEVKACEGCPFRRLFPNNTFVEPQLGSSLRMVIGEAPGEQESIEGKPLVGGSGKVMNMLWGKSGLRRNELTIINTINCRPPDNKFPTDHSAREYCTQEEGEQIVKHCIRNHVLPLLESRPWDRIDLIGEKALRWMTGLKEGIMKWRGSPVEIDTNEIKQRVT